MKLNLHYYNMKANVWDCGGTKDSWLPVAVPWVPWLSNCIIVTEAWEGTPRYTICSSPLRAHSRVCSPQWCVVWLFFLDNIILIDPAQPNVNVQKGGRKTFKNTIQCVLLCVYVCYVMIIMGKFHILSVLNSYVYEINVYFLTWRLVIQQFWYNAKQN